MDLTHLLAALSHRSLSAGGHVRMDNDKDDEGCSAQEPSNATQLSRDRLERLARTYRAKKDFDDLRVVTSRAQKPKA
jgi:hypothetical protein